MKRNIIWVSILMLCASTTAQAPELSSRCARVVTASAEVLHVIDGDSFRARITILPNQFAEKIVRLRGIDAPELRQAACTAERKHALLAKSVLRSLLGKQAYLSNLDDGKYGGRLLATVSTDTHADISAELLARKLARPYGAPQNWCADS